jgi:peptide chain release factor 1
VRCADERSQLKNKRPGHEGPALPPARTQDRGGKGQVRRRIAKHQVGTGERSEKIRTYNFPQNRVTDHRIEVTLYNLAQVIEGTLDDVLEPLLRHDLQERLAALSRQ